LPSIPIEFGPNKQHRARINTTVRPCQVQGNHTFILQNIIEKYNIHSEADINYINKGGRAKRRQEIGNT